MAKPALVVSVVLALGSLWYLAGRYVLPDIFPYLHPDYVVELPNGYRLARTESHDISIAAPEGCYDLPGQPVPPEIIRLNVEGDVVFGQIRRNPELRYIGEFEVPALIDGNFIFDTTTGKLEIGLDRESWLAALKQHGIDKDPSLEKPSRFFRY